MRLKDTDKTKIKGFLYIKKVGFIPEDCEDNRSRYGLIFYKSKDDLKKCSGKIKEIIDYGFDLRQRERDIKRMQKEFECVIVNDEIAG